MILHDGITIAVEKEKDIWRAYAYSKNGWCIAQEKRDTKEEAVQALCEWLWRGKCI